MRAIRVEWPIEFCVDTANLTYGSAWEYIKIGVQLGLQYVLDKRGRELTVREGGDYKEWLISHDNVRGAAYITKFD